MDKPMSKIERETLSTIAWYTRKDMGAYSFELPARIARKAAQLENNFIRSEQDEWGVLYYVTQTGLTALENELDRIHKAAVASVQK